MQITPHLLLSHQIIAPLTAAKWLIKETQKNPTKKDLKTLEKLIKKSLKTAEIALISANVEKNTYKPNFKNTNPKKLIKELIKEFKSQIIAKQLKIEFENNIQTNIKSDPKLLEFILENLMSNAVKYAFESSTIEIKIKTDTKKTMIQIENQGINIEKSDQEKIFTKFFRAQTTEEIPGIGIGLYLSKKAAKQINADLSFESKKSTIRLSLVINNPK
jgi:signal transduction histidine kinase